MNLLAYFSLLWTVTAFVQGASVLDRKNAWSLTRRSPQASSRCIEVIPTPTHLCGARGRYFPKNDYTNHQIVANFNSCRDLTASRLNGTYGVPSDTAGQNYYALSYNETSNECSMYVYNGEIVHGRYRYRREKFHHDNSSDSVFYDSRCFSCVYQCPVPLGVNLFDNSGFESSTEFYGPWSSYFGSEKEHYFPKGISVVSPGSSSNNALHFRPATNIYHLTQIFQACSGYLYSLSFDYKIGSSPQNNHSGISMLFMDDSEVRIPPDSTNGNWITFNDIYAYGLTNPPYPGGGFLMLDVLNGYNGTSRFPSPDLSLDNFFVALLADSFGTKPGASSLVVNGGFETGKLAPWTVGLYYDDDNGKGETWSVVSPGINSNYAFQFVSKDGNAGIQLTQTLKLVKGTNYMFSIDVIGTTVGFTAMNIILDGREWNTVGGNTGNDDGLHFTYQQPFTAQGNSVLLTVQVQSSVTLDNISVIELTAQST